MKKEFDVALAEGDDAKIEQLVQDNPWLQDYVEDAADDTDQNVKRVCGAIGIMEDELNVPVPADEVSYSLEMDFGISIPPDQVAIICADLEARGYVRTKAQGYMLTVEGGRVCDKFLNTATDFLGDIPKKDA